MPTVLLSYEFGSGLGHLNRLIGVAKRLPVGCRTVFAVPQPGRQGPVIWRALGDGVKVIQGPVWSAPKDPAARQVPTRTFADVAVLFEYDVVEKLEHMARYTANVLQKISPQLIIADFAPTVRLVSSGRIPTVVAGNGYTIPPPGRPLPLMRPWGQGMHPKSRAHEAGLLGAANEVSARLGGPAIDFFVDLFHGEESFVCTLAEFDPYHRVRSVAPLWPFNVPKMPPARPFAERHGAAVFCYLPVGHRAVFPLIDALDAVGCRTEIYVEGADPRELARRCSPRNKIDHAPADFAAVLPQAHLIVHHGGLGTAFAGLAAGVPQMVLPDNLEHMITAKGLEAFASAVAIGTSRPLGSVILLQRIRNLLADGDRQRAALAGAQELEVRRDENSADRIVAASARYL